MPTITIKKCLTCDIAHEWLFSGATLKELRMIKQLTGMNAAEFGTAGDDGDPDALAALLYVLHKREKITVPFEDIDVDFADFQMEATDEELAAMAELEEKMKAAADKVQAPKVQKSGQTVKAV